MISTTETSRPRRAAAAALRRLGEPPWGWLIPTAVALVISLVWVAIDERAVDWDTSRHLLNTFRLRAALAEGDIGAPIFGDNVNTYPPLLYLVGSIGLAVTGIPFSFDPPVVAAQLVFIPLLGIGCWGAARQAYGNLAGVLAAAVALGSPMVVDQFHVYLLDAPQAACVAFAVWLILASKRFASTRISVLAGIAAGGGMLVKPTTAIFLVGIVAVTLLRGGWRNWRGLVSFAVAGAIVCGPWYVVHFHELFFLSRGATGIGGGGGGAPPTYSYITPPRWSSQNWGWYGWNLMNVQLFFPLFLAFIVGVIAAVWRFVRTRRPEDLTPELLVGGLVSYVACTYLTLKDPRYTLPALVFVAVLATGWVPALLTRTRALAVAATAVVTFAMINLVGVSFGIGDYVAVRGPQAPPTLLGERSLRFYAPTGYLTAGPRRDDVREVMRATKAAGVDYMVLDVGPSDDLHWNQPGLLLLMLETGLNHPPDGYNLEKMRKDTVFLTRRLETPGAKLPAGCGRFTGGWRLYVVRGGNLLAPFEHWNFWCPPGADVDRD